MADTSNTAPLVKLPAEAVQKIRDMQVDIDKAKRAIEALRDLGLVTKDLEDKLAWAEKARDVLLKQFS